MTNILGKKREIIWSVVVLLVLDVAIVFVQVSRLHFISLKLLHIVYFSLECLEGVDCREWNLTFWCLIFDLEPFLLSPRRRDMPSGYKLRSDKGILLCGKGRIGKLHLLSGRETVQNEQVTRRLRLMGRGTHRKVEMAILIFKHK